MRTRTRTTGSAADSPDRAGPGSGLLGPRPTSRPPDRTLLLGTLWGLTNPPPGLILRRVPNYGGELDAVLRALADPTRRAVVERLAKSPAVVSELAAPFTMALPSLMQHLRVLENAGLVTSQKHGRVRTVSLRPGALDVLHLWLDEQRTPAERHADRLGIHLARTDPKDT